MLAELETLQMQNRKDARDKFIAAAWRNRPADELLALAAEAGLTGAEGDALLEKIGQARQQIAHVGQLPRLRKDAADANRRYEKAQAQVDAEIAKLESQARDAGYEAEVARKAMCEAEECSRQLLVLHDEGLLPATEIPNEVLGLIERREAEANFHKLSEARTEACDERDRFRAIVRNIEERLAKMPLALTSRYEQSALEERLKAAKRQLDQAETALKKAEAVADAARRAIP